MSDEEKEGLLHPESDNDEISKRPRFLDRLHLSGSLIRIYLVISHIVFLITILSLLHALEERPEEPPDLYSPARAAVRHVIKDDYYVNRTMTSPYMGLPSQDIEDRWLGLIDPTYLSLTAEEVSAAGYTTSDNIHLESGPYLGVLAAYHQLHCLRRLRHFLYRETYYPWYNSTDHNDYLHGHMDHCLEVLRLVVMCHGDVSLYTYTWHEDYPNAVKNIVSRIGKERKCVDWGGIQAWAKSRQTDFSPRLVAPDGNIIVANDQS